MTRAIVTHLKWVVGGSVRRFEVPEPRLQRKKLFKHHPGNQRHMGSALLHRDRGNRTLERQQHGGECGIAAGLSMLDIVARIEPSKLQLTAGEFGLEGTARVVGHFATKNTNDLLAHLQ
jgi:hypothetical protein